MSTRPLCFSSPLLHIKACGNWSLIRLSAISLERSTGKPALLLVQLGLISLSVLFFFFPPSFSRTYHISTRDLSSYTAINYRAWVLAFLWNGEMVSEKKDLLGDYSKTRFELRMRTEERRSVQEEWRRAVLTLSEPLLWDSSVKVGLCLGFLDLESSSAADASLLSLSSVVLMLTLALLLSPRDGMFSLSMPFLRKKHNLLSEKRWKYTVSTFDWTFSSHTMASKSP